MADFRLDGGRIERLFAYFEEERSRRGVGAALVRLTPGQRIDALHVLTALRLEGAPFDGDERGFWAAYLRPVLAETRENAAAFDAAYARLLREHDDPKRSAPEGGRLLLLRAWLWLRRHAALAASLAAACFGLALFSLSWLGMQAPNPPPDQPTERPADPPRRGSGSADPSPDPSVAAYRQALTTVLRAAGQYGNDLTPRELAAVLAGASERIGEPGGVLATMLRQFPLDADAPVPRNRTGDAALRRFAAMLAAAESGAPFTATLAAAASLEGAGPFLESLLAEFGKASDEAGARRPAVQSGWPGWTDYLPYALLVPAAAFAFVGRRRMIDEAVRAALAAVAPRRAAHGERGLARILVTAPLQVRAPPALGPVARRLGRLREAAPGRVLDERASLAATLASGGELAVRMRPASRAVEFLFLIRRRHPNDHQRSRFARLLEGLRGSGIGLAAYDYGPDVRRLVGLFDGRQADLRSLRELHADALLVLVTDGEDLIDPFSQAPRVNATAELRGWSRRMLLTPTPIAEWGEREMALSMALDAPIGRATAAGLGDLPLGLAPDSGPQRAALAAASNQQDPFAATARWRRALAQQLAADPLPLRPALLRLDRPGLLLDIPPPVRPDPDHAGAGSVDGAVADLRRWLGVGFFWFAAAGLYPQLRPDITLWLGHRLHIAGDAENPRLFSELRFEQLCLTPWFAAGRMPDWLREACFRSLSAAERAEAKAAMEELLSGRDSVQPGVRLKLPVFLPSPTGRPLSPDDVMLDLAFGTPGTVDVEAAEREARSAAEERARTQWILGGAQRFAVAAIGVFVAAWLWPPAAAAPHPHGAWWPLAIFAGVSAGSIALFETAPGQALRRRIAGLAAALPRLRRRDRVEALSK
jgi:hypothetical protein